LPFNETNAIVKTVLSQCELTTLYEPIRWFLTDDLIA